ncbi:hypothetical protein RPATATE_0798 [Rickettsia parkeri str. Tate's Hell]|uniref:Uncharacterized protein n=2 Tax=spotted fever group TaxID=114277 RepID=A0ABN4A731_RICS1|nr:hypothetical protein Rsl_899 [Rickettsia slovaca 13-B]KJW00104.1 hypothetical protein RPATATE_0798 [Rickettsia parkeri str. Tate's Hell]
MIIILRYFLAKINKIFAEIVIHISKKSYNLQLKMAIIMIILLQEYRT